MEKLQNYNGRYCEWEFEYAFLDYLEKEGWQYLSGNSIVRASKRDVLYVDDLEQFLSKSNPDLTVDEIRQIMDTVRLVGAESDFAVLHKVYNWMVNGLQFVPQSGLARMVALIDFDEPKNNIFRAVNQFTVEYTDNGQTVNRRPDILLFVNGLPLCVMELKNPADKNATIYAAWEQINIRYWRDIRLDQLIPAVCLARLDLCILDHRSQRFIIDHHSRERDIAFVDHAAHQRHTLARGDLGNIAFQHYGKLGVADRNFQSIQHQRGLRCTALGIKTHIRL